jgi:hypothetical protein
MRLFADLLDNADARAKAEEFWRELLEPVAMDHGWQVPWLTTQPDDGANIFSAWDPAAARGLTLDHMGPEDEEWDVFRSTFDKGRLNVDFLRICTDSSVAHLPAICFLTELWIGAGVPGHEMDAILHRLEGGRRRAWLAEFANTARRDLS